MEHETVGKKILIINAVLTNNGDAAITLALYHELVRTGYQVTIATHYYDDIKLYYSDYPLIAEIGSGFLFRKLPALKTLIKPLLFSRKSEFKGCDAVVSAPGGYMNSYYAFKPLLTFMTYCKSMKKRVGVYANSFGPFSAKDERLLKANSEKLDVLMARDSRSQKTLEKLGIDPERFFQSNDAVFLLDQVQSQNSSGTVALSVRRWKKDSRDMQTYKSMISGLIEITVRKGLKVEFISTCQGFQNYVDDSELAHEIADALPEVLKSAVSVDSGYYSLKEMRQKLSGYEFVIGTRLHMCLLALKSGVPAFNISYEFKGKEAYDYLNMADYSVDFNSSPSVYEEKMKLFITNYLEVKQQIPDLMESQQIMAREGFKGFTERLFSKK